MAIEVNSEGVATTWAQRRVQGYRDDIATRAQEARFARAEAHEAAMKRIAAINRK